MASKTLPKNIVFAMLLSAVAVSIFLSIFYFQYQSLANSIVQAGARQHDASVADVFERESTEQVTQISEAILGIEDQENAELIRSTIADSVANNPTLSGIYVRLPNGIELNEGQVGNRELFHGAQWTPDNLYLSANLPLTGSSPGLLVCNFSLATVRSDSESFTNNLYAQESVQLRSSITWISITTLATLVLGGLVIRFIVKAQTRRIRELKYQAERISDADFGEPLTVKHDDELGELAAMFNLMRERLQATTISRDYVDRVLASMNDAIVITTAEGIISRVNQATLQLLGYEEAELIGCSIEFIVDQKAGKKLRIDAPPGAPLEAFLISNRGESIPVSYTGSVISGGGNDDRVYAAQNITERRKAEQRIRYLARIDALTKVPNRMQFQHLLQRAIARAKRSQRQIALMYIDVDHFKEINDTFGHLAGDATLETVADRLRAALPAKTVIGRLAGDEFAVIVEELDTDDDGSNIDKLSRAVLDRLADPFYVQGHEVFMTASMGIGKYPEDAPNVIDLIRNADAALYHSKKNGGNIFSYYSPEMNEAAVERLMTKSKLKRAFERDELLVHYQPKYNIKTGEVIGAEALVRWELPDRGLVLPSDFIPIAEDSNLIIEIGEWVLDRVCEDFRRWQRSVESPGRISVNLSLKQLRQPNFISRISSILRSYELSPTSLELEITETTLMEDPVRTIKLLDELYSLGLYLAIDDFGTGYSSLSALQQFPINTLKIDKSFVRDAAVNADDATIVGTIIHMGRSLKMDVVAEGVENEAQLNFLQTLDCTYVQGLLFGEPMNSDSYLNLLLAQADGTDTYRALFA